MTLINVYVIYLHLNISILNTLSEIVTNVIHFIESKPFFCLLLLKNTKNTTKLIVFVFYNEIKTKNVRRIIFCNTKKINF